MFVTCARVCVRVSTLTLLNLVVPALQTTANEFQVITPQRTYALAASTEQEMRQWVATLDARRQRLIRESRDGQDAASLRRGSVGSNFPLSMSSFASGTGPRSASRPQPTNRRAVHTMTAQQARQFSIGRRAMTTTDDNDEAPAASSSPSSSPSAVSRALSGISLQSGSNRRSALSSSQTSLALDNAVERSAADEATSNVRNSIHAGQADVGISVELAEENKKLRLKIAELENDLDERESMVRDLKQQVTHDL